MKATKIKPNILVSYEMDIFEKGNLFKVPFHYIITDINVMNMPKSIVNLIEDYAYELDTEINNLDYKITKIKFKTYEGS